MHFELKMQVKMHFTRASRASNAFCLAFCVQNAGSSSRAGPAARMVGRGKPLPIPHPPLKMRNEAQKCGFAARFVLHVAF